MKVSLITTIYNEENTIEYFLDSIKAQSVLPNEVIIVDGGSIDATIERVKNYELRIKNNQNKFNLKLFIKRGNRSVGRNEGIRRSQNDIILLTDAGCLLDKDWVKEIQKPFTDKKVDVVAGYYSAKAETIFQKCLIPYALVMPDRVDPKTFLPATRSMAIKKETWKDIGGFNERFSHNEDYVFSRKLRDSGKKIVFVKEAVAYWIPRRTFKEAFIMFRRFAYGDIEAGIIRPKVVVLFIRYLFILMLVIMEILTQGWKLLAIIFVLLVLYTTWAVVKNFRFVRDWRALYYLPLIQFTADFAVIYGSVKSFLMRKLV